MLDDHTPAATLVILRTLRRSQRKRPRECRAQLEQAFAGRPGELALVFDAAQAKIPLDDPRVVSALTFAAEAIRDLPSAKYLLPRYLRPTMGSQQYG